MTDDMHYRRMLVRRKLTRQPLNRPFGEHPPMPEPFVRYTHKWVSRHFWKVARYFNHDKCDAVQECALLYVKCCHHYGWLIDNPAWMMALYKQALHHRWINLAKRNTRLCAALVDESVDNIADEAQEFTLRLAEQPRAVQDVLHRMAQTPEALYGDDLTLAVRKLGRDLGHRLPVDIMRRLHDLLHS